MDFRRTPQYGAAITCYSRRRVPSLAVAAALVALVAFGVQVLS